MRIFLIGYMGCGKSTLGRRVASAMGLKFVDMDYAIEAREQSTIREIFAAKGEPYFRELERMVLADLLEEEDVVVATGGGVPCQFDNMAMIKEKAISIYLDVDCDAITARLIKGRHKRPLVASKTDDELREFVVENIAKREPFYSQANLRVSGRGIKATEVIDAINYHIDSLKEENEDIK